MRRLQNATAVGNIGKGLSTKREDSISAGKKDAKGREKATNSEMGMGAICGNQGQKPLSNYLASCCR
jgi:hypothetical protein